MKNLTLIITSEHVMFRHWCHENGLHHLDRSVKFVHHPRIIEGLRLREGDRVVWTGRPPARAHEIARRLCSTLDLYGLTTDNGGYLIKEHRDRAA